MNNAGETHKASVVSMVWCRVFRCSATARKVDAIARITTHNIVRTITCDAGAVKLKTMAKRLARSILHFFERLTKMKREKKREKIWIQLICDWRGKYEIYVFTGAYGAKHAPNVRVMYFGFFFSVAWIFIERKKRSVDSWWLRLVFMHWIVRSSRHTVRP